MILTQKRSSACLVGDEPALAVAAEASADSARRRDGGAQGERLGRIAGEYIFANQGALSPHAGGADGAHLGAGVRRRLRCAR